ncbi:MAG TPA: cobalamin biosynthesis protein CobW [Lachnospiraceae bacterium]|jgi:G3E family GTPase|nr:cobalamin biosynthesis protein CobW [Lachnospiraceae bacterium]
MTKIDIVSGFLGAGKTTLIKKLLNEALKDSKVVLIENEFGEIGIDGGFLKDAGIEIKEMNSGCICCSLVGDFGTSLKEVMKTYQPERILIEPSGVGKLSDVMKAVQDVIDEHEVVLNSAVAVVDASKCKMYIKNFGEFFINQIEHAGTIILSRTGNISEDKLKKAVELIREHNTKATIITTPWDELDGKVILATIEGAADLEAELMAELKEQREHDHEHEHHHHDHDGECCHHDHDHHHEDEEEHEHEHHHHDHDGECCHHDHDHHHEDEEEHEHEHHHHDHDGECCHHDHDHHHEHGEDCTCGCHDHDHDHHHHHADEIFGSWGMETPDQYSKEDLEKILEALGDDDRYGMVLRAKGMVPCTEGGFIYFDYVPGESNIRPGKPDVTGKFCVIGSKLKEEALKELFSK